MMKVDSIHDEIERFLAFLYLCEEKPHAVNVKAKNVDGAVPMINADASKTFSGIPMNAGEPALWPIRSYAASKCDGDAVGVVQFNGMSSLDFKEARKLGVSRFAKHMVVRQTLAVDADGKGESAFCPFSLVGEKWVDARPLGRNDSRADGVHESICVLLGLALALRYEWTTWIGYGDGPRLRFMTDPEGAMAIFRLREIPDGKLRRAALRNWVADHWRRKRKDSAEESKAWIARHLRGATDFSWNGMRCRIEPPAFEVERLEAQKLAKAR